MSELGFWGDAVVCLFAAVVVVCFFAGLFVAIWKDAMTDNRSLFEVRHPIQAPATQDSRELSIALLTEALEHIHEPDDVAEDAIREVLDFLEGFCQPRFALRSAGGEQT